MSKFNQLHSWCFNHFGDFEVNNKNKRSISNKRRGPPLRALATCIGEFLTCILMSSFVLLSGQLLKDIPWSVLSEVIMHLNNPSPLRNNWKAVAAELSLSFQTVQSLDHHVSGGMTEGVLQIMFQRKMTVQDFANMMEKIQRPDIVDTLVKAGLPENNIGKENKNGMVQSS